MTLVFKIHCMCKMRDWRGERERERGRGREREREREGEKEIEREREMGFANVEFYMCTFKYMLVCPMQFCTSFFIFFFKC